MKTLTATLLVVALAGAAGALEQSAGSPSELPTHGKGGWLIAQEEAAKEQAAKEQPPKETKSKSPGAEELRKRIAETKKKLGQARGKIEADHVAWAKSDKAMETARARIAKLEADLQAEQARFKKLEDTVARIEKEHEGDHAVEEALVRELAGHEKDLAALARREDEISKLEKQAETLRREAAKLRKRAEELKKN